VSHRWLLASVAFVAFGSLIALSPPRPKAVPSSPQVAPAASKPTPPDHVVAPSSLWVVQFDLSKWDSKKPAQDQPGFMEHIQHVHEMAADGTLMVGGPLMDDPETFQPTGAMMIVKAESAEAAKKLCSSDALIKNDLMKITSVRGFYAGAGHWLPPESPASDGAKH